VIAMSLRESEVESASRYEIPFETFLSSHFEGMMYPNDHVSHPSGSISHHSRPPGDIFSLEI
jgi:hypothetical protein